MARGAEASRRGREGALDSEQTRAPRSSSQPTVGAARPAAWARITSVRAARISLIPTAAALPASGLARVLARSCAPARVHEGERCGSRGCAGRVQRHGAAGGDEKGTGGRARRGAGGECGHWRPARRFNSSARSRARLPQEGSTARCGGRFPTRARNVLGRGVRGGGALVRFYLEFMGGVEGVLLVGAARGPMF